MDTLKLSTAGSFYLGIAAFFLLRRILVAVVALGACRETREMRLSTPISGILYLAKPQHIGTLRDFPTDS
jgi:hypothetical protein